MCAAPAVWNHITQAFASTQLATPTGKLVYLTNGTSGSRRWLIGPHGTLKEQLPLMRGSPLFTQQLASMGVRYGRRIGDNSPKNVSRTHTSFRDKIGLPADMGQDEYDGILMRDGGKGLQLPESQRDAYVAAQPRRQNHVHKVAGDFFGDATVESHHIVEKFLIREFGALTGELSIENAPCVAASKEPHSRLFTSKIAEVRGEITTVAKARTEYAKLYAPAEFGDLLKIANAVLDEVERV